MFSNTPDGQQRQEQFIIGVIFAVACLMLIGSFILVSIGYLNGYSSLGVGILAIGVVLYLVAAVMLGVGCMWVNKNDSGNMLQPTSRSARRSIDEASVSFINESNNEGSLRSTNASTVLSPAALSDNKQFQPDQVKDHLNSSTKDLQIGDFSTKPSTSIPSNEKAVSHQELDQHRQGIISKAPCTKDFTASLTSNGKSTAAQKQNHCQQRKIPQAPYVKDIITTPKSLQATGNLYQAGQQLGPNYKDSIPKTQCAKGFSIKLASDQKQDQYQQGEIPKVLSVKNFTTTPTATLPMNGKSTFDQKQDDSQQDIIPKALYCNDQKTTIQCLSSRAQQTREVTAMLPNTVLNNGKSVSDQKLQSCLQDTALKVSQPLITTPVPAACHSRNQEPSSRQKCHQCNPNIISNATNSRNTTVTNIVDESLPIYSGKAVSHQKQDQHTQDVTKQDPQSGTHDASKGIFPSRDMDIVLHYKHDKLHKGVPHTAPCTTQLNGVGYLPNTTLAARELGGRA